MEDVRSLIKPCPPIKSPSTIVGKIDTQIYQCTQHHLEVLYLRNSKKKKKKKLKPTNQTKLSLKLKHDGMTAKGDGNGDGT